MTELTICAEFPGQCPPSKTIKIDSTLTVSDLIQKLVNTDPIWPDITIVKSYVDGKLKELSSNELLKVVIENRSKVIVTGRSNNSVAKPTNSSSVKLMINSQSYKSERSCSKQEEIRRKILDKDETFLDSLTYQDFKQKDDFGTNMLAFLVGQHWTDGLIKVMRRIPCSSLVELILEKNSAGDTAFSFADKSVKRLLARSMFPDDTGNMRVALMFHNWDYREGKLEQEGEQDVNLLATKLCSDTNGGLYGLPHPDAIFFNSLEGGIYHRMFNGDERQYIQSLKKIRRNCSYEEMKEEIAKFTQLLHKFPTIIGLIYFSGHGGSENHVQYLYPVDYKEELEAKDYCVSLTQLAKDMSYKRERSTNIIILDCCRVQSNYDDTQEEIDAREKASFEGDYVRGIFIAYASRPGREAYGLKFTQTITECLGLPLELEQFFRLVRYLYAKDSAICLSWIESNLERSFYFTPMTIDSEGKDTAE